MNSVKLNQLILLMVLALVLFVVIQCSDDNKPTTYEGDTDTLIDSTSDTTSDTITDTTVTAMILADHRAVAAFDSVTPVDIAAVQSGLRFFYGHTSHGSQIITGLNMLLAENSDLTIPPIHEISDDLGELGDTSWVPPTRIYLNANSTCNVVMWSWCGGCSNNTVDGINAYLNAMSGLEADYPDVKFIYMTGHLDGTGIDGNLYARNNQIRDYCEANDKILFDFADIESYDPAGEYYFDATDACEWCYDWCAAYTCPTCTYCAHSHCFNCYIKGKAMWWLMAQLVL